MSKVVWISGASGGVGRGIALACAELGWTVWVTARREEMARRVAEEVEAAGGHGRGAYTDVCDAASIEESLAAAVELDGRLDGVVHNATSGLSPLSGDLAAMSVADLREHIDVSLRGSYLIARNAYPHLVASQGSLLLLTSEAGFEGRPKLAAYSAVKGAQRGLASSLAREWGASGVRVNALAPLALSPAMERAFDEDPELAARVLGRNPLGRIGDPVSDVGVAARFLLSDDARYITGQTLRPDGGALASH